MVRIALAPCSPFSVTPELMLRTAELAERLDVRLHTHLAEDPDEDAFARSHLRHAHDRALRGRRLVHRPVVGGPLHLPQLGRDRPSRRRRRRGRPLPVVEHDDRRWRHRTCARAARRRRAGRARLRRLVVHRQRLALDGGAQRDAARPVAARASLDRARATRSRSPPGAGRGASAAPVSWASCRRARSATWSSGRSTASRSPAPSPTPSRPGSAAGPVAARHTVIAGKSVVRDGRLVSDRVDEQLRLHRRVAERLQAPAST